MYIGRKWKYPYPWEVPEDSKTYIALPTATWENEGRDEFARPSCYGAGRLDVAGTSYLVLIGKPDEEQREWLEGNATVFEDGRTWDWAWKVHYGRELVDRLQPQGEFCPLPRCAALPGLYALYPSPFTTGA